MEVRRGWRLGLRDCRVAVYQGEIVHTGDGSGAELPRSTNSITLKIRGELTPQQFGVQRNFGLALKRQIRARERLGQLQHSARIRQLKIVFVEIDPHANARAAAHPEVSASRV